jgi:hypothetical protein
MEQLIAPYREWAKDLMPNYTFDGCSSFPPSTHTHTKRNMYMSVVLTRVLGCVSATAQTLSSARRSSAAPSSSGYD